MKKHNGWIPISILLGIVLTWMILIFGYIMIFGRNFYSFQTDYDLPETDTAVEMAVNAEVNTAEVFDELSLKPFLVTSKTKTVAGDDRNRVIKVDDEKSEYEAFSDNRDEDYIIHYSDHRKLTEEDLESLTPKELSYARNEIYARHGRRFQSSELQGYFDTKEWYEIDENFDDRDLKGIERTNAEFISEYQKQNGKMYKVS